MDSKPQGPVVVRRHGKDRCAYVCPYYQDGPVFSRCNKYVVMGGMTGRFRICWPTPVSWREKPRLCSFGRLTIDFLRIYSIHADYEYLTAIMGEIC